MDEEVKVVFSLLGMPVTAYGLCLAAAAALGIALLLGQCRKKGLKPDTAVTIALLAIPLGLIGARLFYCVTNIYLLLELGLDQTLRLWEGGYALWGAVGGAALAAVIAARLTGQRIAPLMDAMAAPGALMIALMRFAEYFTGQGLGPYVESDALSFFPLAMQNSWGEWYYSVFMAEGIAALVILLVLLRKERGQGDAARLFLILYSSAQVLLESVRRTGVIRWLFVRVSQLTAALVMGALMLAALVKWLQTPENRRMGREKVIACWAVFLVCVGVCIWMEFAVDKSPDLPVWAAYCIMAVCCVGLGMTAYQLVMRSRLPQTTGNPPVSSQGERR